MKLSEIQDLLPTEIFDTLSARGIDELRPAQAKAVQAGVLEGSSVLVCTPTASGKTLIAELTGMQHIMQGKKTIYIVPLKALASEKYREFKERYDGLCKVGLSIGDVEGSDFYLARSDFILITSEKLDAVLRQRPSWIHDIGCVIVDEVHLLNDASRGPTLEVVITLLRSLVPSVQWVCLSATIGNPSELSAWLGANLVEDDWRPVPLKEGIYDGENVTFYKTN